MTKPQLCLPAPRGLGQKSFHLSIRAPSGDRDVAEGLAELSESFGCPSKLSYKVRECIFHSGRYDTLVAPYVNVKDVQFHIQMRGWECVITEMQPIKGWDRSYSIDRLPVHASYAPRHADGHDPDSYLTSLDVFELKLVRLTTIGRRIDRQAEEYAALYGFEREPVVPTVRRGRFADDQPKRPHDHILDLEHKSRRFLRA